MMYLLNLVFAICTGTPYTQQSYKVSEYFPYRWINKKWKEGFHVTSMGTAGNRWVVVMSRNTGYSDQVKTRACSSCLLYTQKSSANNLFMNFLVPHM
jgi:hypothetical protein